MPFPKSCQAWLASVNVLGATCWLTVAVARTLLPSWMVYGVLSAAPGSACHVAETRYWPGTRPANVQVAVFEPDPAAMKVKPPWKPTPGICVHSPTVLKPG